MLTEFFRIYSDGQEPNKYLYRDFPKYYRWFSSQRIWVKRRSTQKVIGRVYAVSPSEGERFYLRVILNHIEGPKSFDDLLIIDGVHYLTFKQAAEKRGFLQEDNSIRECLVEAQSFRKPSALRRLFATILLYCEPNGVRSLWEENYSYMIEDYPSSRSSSSLYVLNKLLHDLNGILMQHKRSINEFDLPQITGGFEDLTNIPSLIEHELSIPISETDLNAVRVLNDCGTGKTFLYKSLLANFQKDGLIMLAIATSGIAANLLPGGRTAHSKLKIPIKFEPLSMCLFSKQSELSTLIERASAIIWDKAPMANRKAFETVDRTFRDILGVDLPFGGKIMILGGDFRQVLPVVIGGTKLQIINASIVQSPLWSNVRLLHLSENMRAQNDDVFSDFLLRIGNGDEPTIEGDMIRISDCMAIPWEGEHSIEQLINFIFPELSSHAYDPEYIASRALLTPLNDDVNKLNEKVLIVFHGVTYYSFDSVADDARNLYLPEFLNSLSPGSLPPHKLTLKRGSPIMLLRNIDPKIGLCNGTRLICHRFGRNIIDAEILARQFKGMRVFIPRIPLKSAEDASIPFEMTRRQFPVRLSFALTINKSQGQTIPNVGIYLRSHVFSHGQLYVALSQGISETTTKVLVRKGSVIGHEGVYTKNVVFKEIFAKLQSSLTITQGESSR
ncbi:UNVERIFIED_CONTAM: ATP-dependent DNA helicase PIF6 [Sesamum radiatum]|uniref:ATP-dependent DNA helicase n=1 Tax=Sesamum radiatum TaxID=300843 RepID=A0AAW2NBF3_SESRA